MAQNLLFVSMHIFVWLQISLGSIFLRKCWVPLLFYKTYKKKILSSTPTEIIHSALFALD